MGRPERLDLLSAIEEARGSAVIAYVTSDREGVTSHIEEDVVPILQRHIEAIPAEKRGKLDLFLYSRGGDADVPWTIISMMREYATEGQLGVLIPYRAHSAATVIALGADEIVMGKKAELGPIDATIGVGPYNPVHPVSKAVSPVEVESVSGYFSHLERIGCGSPSDKLRAFELLSKHVHPLALGAVSRRLEQTQLVAKRMLGTRAKPLPEEANDKIVRALSSEIYSHRHAISRTEAANHVGLSQVVKSEDAGIMDSLWSLYEAYAAELEFDTPFEPEGYLIDNDLDAYTWNDVPWAVVESKGRLDMRFGKVTAIRHRNVPPDVNLNVNLPALTLPALPAGVTPDQIQALFAQIAQDVLAPVVTVAAKEATDRLVISLPTRNFVTVVRVSWRNVPDPAPEPEPPDDGPETDPPPL